MDSDSVTTPLLISQHGHEGSLPAPASAVRAQDHPAFLRACHSPWRWLPQNALCYVRGTILAYLIAVGIMILDFKIEKESDFSSWRILFQYEVISFALVLAYHAVVFSWTFTHLYFPRIDDCRTGWEYWVLRSMSLPYNMGSLRKQFYFTLFYFAASVSAVVNTLLYWFVTLPHQSPRDDDPASPQPSGDLDQAASPMRMRDAAVQVVLIGGSNGENPGRTPFTDIFGEGWFNAFIVLNLFAISTAIVVVELFFLNSIKRPIAVGAHIFGLLFLTGLYLGWASVGKVLTGADSFYWLNEEEVGSREAVVANCIGFVVLSPIVFAFVYGLISIREALYKSSSRSRANRQALQSSRDE